MTTKVVVGQEKFENTKATYVVHCDSILQENMKSDSKRVARGE